MITYPRKCNTCSHIANNPTNWHYHKQIHKDIPEGQLCDFGCETKANFRKTTGKYSCLSNTHQCPGYLRQHSEQTLQQWKNNNWENRKKVLTNRTKNETKIQIQARAEKQIKTKRAKRLACENTSDMRKYKRLITYHSYRSYEIHKEDINPNNLPIGKLQYHIDHKVSKHVGWFLKIPIDIMSHPKNLQILEYDKNAMKSSKCSLNPIQLLEECGVDDKLISYTEKQLMLVEHLLP
jgi:hypothetical protein